MAAGHHLLQAVAIPRRDHHINTKGAELAPFLHPDLTAPNYPVIPDSWAIVCFSVKTGELRKLTVNYP